MDRLIPVTFRFPSMLTPNAQRVSLMGPFNGWTPDVHPLARAGEYWWTITLHFPPGRIVYTFDVDGTVWLDPNDTGWTPERPGVRILRPQHRAASESPSRGRPRKDPVGIREGAQRLEC